MGSQTVTVGRYSSRSMKHYVAKASSQKGERNESTAQLLPQDQVLRAAAHGMVLPTVKVGSPRSVNLI